MFLKNFVYVIVFVYGRLYIFSTSFIIEFDFNTSCATTTQWVYSNTQTKKILATPKISGASYFDVKIPKNKFGNYRVNGRYCQE